jgi:acyl-CoA dehydrogenase
MQFNFTEEQQAFADSVRRFARAHLEKDALKRAHDPRYPFEVAKLMSAQGLMGISLAEADGGQGGTLMDAVIAIEQVAAVCPRSADVVQFGNFGPIRTFAEYGTPQQKARWLGDLLQGRMVMSLGITEPDAGSDVAAIRTTARREGGDYVLNGTKMFITNGVHADLVFVAARTDPAVKGTRGISIFAVERCTPGFSVGRALKKQGWLSSDTAELIFADCRVPAANRLGEEQAGFYAVMRNFQNERLVLGAMAIGEAQAALELTLAYVRERRAFGGVLWDKQAIRQRLAMLAAKIAAGRELVYATAWRDARGEECVREVSMVKAYCGELVNEAMYDCQQFHGGFGYIRESAIERMVRDARIHAIGGGATEVMLEEVAKRLHF